MGSGYDIYFLATSFEFEGRKLREAIQKTFSTRGTPFEKDSVLVIERLIANEVFMIRWDNFCKKVLKYELSFSEVVQLIVSFLEPPFQAIINKEELYKNWNSDKKRYQ
ncbi:MAG: nucleotidyl transferase AbiEii/AbiGii toxin family protein [Bacillota bacterium]